MKQIVYMWSDGKMALHTPSYGFRNAFKVTMPDGKVVTASESLKQEFAAIDRLAGMWPVPGAIPEWAETEDELVQRIIAKDVPEQYRASCTVIESGDLPQGRASWQFRWAWDIVDRRVVVNMVWARKLHMNRIRMMRDKKRLPELDGLWMRAMGQKNEAEAARIDGLRQDLRELPQTLDLEKATTPEELAAIWPDDLPPFPLPDAPPVLQSGA